MMNIIQDNSLSINCMRVVVSVVCQAPLVEGAQDVYFFAILIV